MPLSDNQIEAMKAVSDGFINLHGKKIPGAISYGVTSYGYDMRLGYKFRVFKPYPCTVIDPKNFDDRMLEYVDLTPKYCEFVRGNHSHLLVECKYCTAHTTFDNQKHKFVCKGQPQPENFLLIPPHSFVLAESMETFNVPRDCVGIVVGKSTYARCGLVVNCTPMEPEWRGRLTIELSNTTPLPLKIYTGEGIAQVLFFRNTESPCTISYADKQGKYQNQTGVTNPIVQHGEGL